MDAVTLDDASGREARYDARGLVEPDETVPRTAEIDGRTATFDAHDLTTRQINLELRRLLYERGHHRRHRAQPGRAALARASASSRAARSPSRAASATSAAA